MQDPDLSVRCSMYLLLLLIGLLHPPFRDYSAYAFLKFKFSYVYACHSAHTEVRGQLRVLCSLLMCVLGIKLESSDLVVST